MINIDKSELIWNIQQLKSRNFKNLREKKRIKKKWDFILENEAILSSFKFETMIAQIVPINYRPFDIRYVINYTINRRCGSSAILTHLQSIDCRVASTNIKKLLNSANESANIGFNFVQSVQKPPFNHVFITNGLVDSGLFGYSTSKVAPLWIEGKMNLVSTFMDEFKKKWNEATYADCIGYIYGLLQSEWYAKKFGPFLLHHFPRIKIFSDLALIKEISAIGLKLIQLHLAFSNIESHHKDNSGIRLIRLLEPVPKNYNLLMTNFRYSEPNHTLILYFSELNEASLNEKYLMKIQEDVWNFKIGSIQVLKYWLKNRIYMKLNRSWTELEWIQLDRIIHTIEQNLITKTRLTQKISKEI